MTAQQSPDRQNETSDEVLANTAQLAAQSARTLALHISQHDDIDGQAEERAKIVTEKVILDLESAQGTAVYKATEEVEERLKRQFQAETARIIDDFNSTLREAVETHAAELRNMLLTLEKSRQEDREEHQRQMQEVEAGMAKANEEADKRRTELEEAHENRIAAAAEAIRAEREKQLAEYETLRSETTASIQEMTEGALSGHSKSIDAKLEQSSRETDARFEENAKAIDARFSDTEKAAADRAAETDEFLAKSEARWRRTAIITAGAAATATGIAIAALAAALL